METSSNHNDPLEEFFREKSRDYDITYHEEDWQKLESRLDRADQIRKKRRRRHLVTAAAIILLGVLFYATWTQQLKINELEKQLSNSEQTVTPDAQTGEPHDDTLVESRRPSALNNSGQESPTSKNIDQNDRKRLVTSNSNSNGSIAQEPPENNLQPIQPAKPISEKHVDVAHAASEFKGRFADASAILTPISGTHIPNADKAESRYSNTIVSSDHDVFHQNRPKLSIGVVGGPGLSTVGGISNFQKPGYSLGISVEYHFSKKLAISAGAHRSKVQYVATGNEYNPPDGYWSYGIVPERTNGVCMLIDIPISLKYTFKHFEASRLFVSTGLSSYIMLDEDYRFDYEGNHPQLNQRWHKRTGTRHWMSNATLSVGYELDIAHKISLRAEPFIKLPLQEVGWGNVSLYSMGSFFSVNYHIK